MKRYKLASALALVALLVVAPLAWCDENRQPKPDPAPSPEALAQSGPQPESTTTEPSSGASQPASAETSQQKKSSSGKLETVRSIPRRFLPFCAGLVVGVPVAFVRKTAQETQSGVVDLVGEKTTNPLITVPAALFSLPFAAVSGGFEGTYFGAVDSWEASDSKPFSKDSFSLGQMR